MASTVFYAFSLCLLLHGVLTKPVAQDSKMEQAFKYGEIKPFDHPVTVLSGEEKSDNGEVKSLEKTLPTAASSFTELFEHFRRAKREAIVSRGCPEGMIRFMKRCMTFERYERIVKEEDEE